MGMCSLGKKRRNTVMSWGRRFSSRGNSVALVNVQQGVAMDSCYGSSAARQLLWRLRSVKSQWKENMRWQRKGLQFSYDPQSYSLNFDDGFPDD